MTDYIVKDISLADFSRKELDIAETEMPGLMALREVVMKNNSDNFRQSSAQDIITILEQNNIDVAVYEPEIYRNKAEHQCESVSLSELKTKSDIILANRMSKDLDDVADKVFTRDLFNEN